MKRTIIFIAGGALLAWGAFCYYQQEQKKKQPAGGTGGTDMGGATPQVASKAETPELAVQPGGAYVETTITDEPLLLPPESQAVQYFNTNPSALYYRPRTTIAVDPAIAQDVITIDSANTYSR